MRRARRFLAFAAMVVCAFLPGIAQDGATRRPVAVVAELDGIIHPISAEYLTNVIGEADTTGADLVVFILRTPGGLLDSTQTIVSRMITSRAPVAVLVAPSGARAASAGFVITIAADIAAMAPGTHIGAAHPVAGGGQQMDETMSQKAASDTAAYVRSLAEARGRNVTLAEDAVFNSRAFTDREALQASPPLIDLNARDVNELLDKLDGRTIKRFDGRQTTLRTRGADVRQIDMSWRQRFLGAIAHPQVAYILMSLGILGLTVEVWSPGAILPGVVGGVCLLLILLGLALLILELKVPSFGALGIGGTISLVVGSIMLTRGSVPGVDVNLGFIIPIAIGLAGILLVLGRLALKAQRLKPVSGAEAMIGIEGRARDTLEPGGSGYVDVHGEMWRALARAAVPAGGPVRVVGMNGLTLIVEPSRPSAREGESS